MNIMGSDAKENKTVYNASPAVMNEIPGEKTLLTLFTSSQMSPSHCPLQGLFIAWVFPFVQIHVPRWPPGVKPSPNPTPHSSLLCGQVCWISAPVSLWLSEHASTIQLKFSKIPLKDETNSKFLIVPHVPERITHSNHCPLFNTVFVL